MIFYSFNVPSNYLTEFCEYQDFMFCYPDEDLSLTFALEKNLFIMLSGNVKDGSKALPLNQLTDLAIKFNVKEVVAPYVPYNADKTYACAYDMFKYIEKRGVQSKFDVIVVPQGRSLGELFECAKALLKLPAVTLGVHSKLLRLDKPYLLEQIRFSLIKKLFKGKLLTNKHIHLLDLYGLQYLRAYSKIRGKFKIRSLNTDFPVALGILGKTFKQTTKRPKVGFNDGISLSKETIERIKENIVFFKEYK